MRIAAVLSLVIVLSVGTTAEQERAVALTFDDLPSADSEASMTVRAEIDAITRALSTHKAVATGFVIGHAAKSLPGSGDMLRAWTAAGHSLGNHTYSHRSVNELSVEQFAEDIDRAEPAFTSLLPRDHPTPKYLRFPFNHTGESLEKVTALQGVLAERDYRVAVCTIENADYLFARAYAKVSDGGDVEASARLKREYVAYTGAMIDYFVGLHRSIFGRETSHVMLLHVNRLNAEVLTDLLALFEARHFTFVTLQEAQADDAYRTPVTWFTAAGPMWAYRWARSLGIRVDGRKEPVPPGWIEAYAK